jgi:hypothetical protein
MWIYRAFSSAVRAKYSIASTGTDSTQELKAAAAAGGRVVGPFSLRRRTEIPLCFCVNYLNGIIRRASGAPACYNRHN